MKKDIEASLHKLEMMLNQIDFKDKAWINELQSIVADLTFATNYYALETTKMSDELISKYSETITSYEEGITTIKKVIGIIKKGLESFKEEVLLKIHNLLLTGNQQIEIALETLDEDKKS